MSGQIAPSSILDQDPLPALPPHKNPSVRVVCRIKPLGDSEQPIEMSIEKAAAQISIPQPRQDTTKTFTFNRVYTNEKQDEFVSDVCDRVLNEAIASNQGYLIFSYGVTNSGKTHTILGSQAQPGILPYLVSKLSQQGQVYLSAIELYNDEFFSLTNKQKLAPRQINGFLDFSQCNISQAVDSTNMEHKFKQYLNNRSQNETKLNAKSSRSHAIFRIKFNNVVIGVVDLAGSQRTNRVFASIDETSNINKSLLCLGRCIKALNQNHESDQPIPYRESKLTKVLIEYFAAKVEVLMVANINQSQTCFHENMKVLDYAVLAKDIRHCTTDNSLKKSQFKYPKSNTKIDVFKILHQSAMKSVPPHKSLKSSAVRYNDGGKSNIKAMGTSKKFAQALKIQQLQMCIQRFDSSQETFDYMLHYMSQKETEEDQRRIESIKSYQYQSPFLATKSQPIQTKDHNDVGSGRTEKSMQAMKNQLRQEMKQELRILLQVQRLANMQDKQTAIGNSLLKEEPVEKQDSNTTPQKTKHSNQPQQDSFITKTSRQIYSSVKKILSKNVPKLKEFVPKFLKSSSKMSKMKICNYGQNFDEIFKHEAPQTSRSSNFSFKDKLQNYYANEQKHHTCEQVQTDDEITFNNRKHQQSQDTRQNSQNSYEITKQVEMQVRNSNCVIHANPMISQVDEQDKNQNQENNSHSNMPVSQATEQSVDQKNKNRKRGRKPKVKAAQDKKNRVAEIRKMAARLCREGSRTPLKKRLRSHHG